MCLQHARSSLELTMLLFLYLSAFILLIQWTSVRENMIPLNLGSLLESIQAVHTGEMISAWHHHMVTLRPSEWTLDRGSHMSFTTSLNCTGLLSVLCSLSYFPLCGPSLLSLSLSLESKGYLLSSTLTMLPKQQLKHPRVMFIPALLLTPLPPAAAEHAHIMADQRCILDRLLFTFFCFFFCQISFS